MVYFECKILIRRWTRQNLSTWPKLYQKRVFLPTKHSYIVMIQFSYQQKLFLFLNQLQSCSAEKITLAKNEKIMPPLSNFRNGHCSLDKLGTATVPVILV